MVTFIAADMVRRYRIKQLFKVNSGNYSKMAGINRTVIKTHLETTIITVSYTHLTLPTNREV